MPLPNPPVSAKDAALPALSRRALIAGAASVALSTAAPAPAALPTQSPDAELMALRHRFEQALTLQAAAWQRLQECEERYLNDGPEPPSALTSAGPLDQLLDRDDSWWSARELRWLLRSDRRRSVQRHARALLKVALAYAARDRRFQRRIGLPAAEAAHRAASAALDELSRAILAAPAHSALGLAVKAQVVKAWGKPDWWSAEESHADSYERLAAQVLDAVLARAA